VFTAVVWPFVTSALTGRHWWGSSACATFYVVAILTWMLTWLPWASPLSGWDVFALVAQLLLAVLSSVLGGFLGWQFNSVMAGDHRLSCLYKKSNAFVSKSHFALYAFAMFLFTLLACIYELTLAYAPYGEIWYGILTMLILGGLALFVGLRAEQIPDSSVAHTSDKKIITGAFVWQIGVIGFVVVVLYLNLIWRTVPWMWEVWIQMMGVGYILIVLIVVTFVIQGMKLNKRGLKRTGRLTGRDGLDDMDEG